MIYFAFGLFCNQCIYCTQSLLIMSGESYMDVTLRLETIVFDIERTREPILIVGKCWVDCSHILSFCEQTLSISLL